jgi:hypothetical protein
MGMHHGLIVFRGDINALSSALRDRNGTLGEFGQPTQLENLSTDDEHGFPCAFRTFDGVTVFFDGSMMLGGDLDLIALLATRTGSIAAGCVGETASGTYQFCSADASGVRRGFWHCHASQSEPWSYGAPLDCETAHPFDDVDGDGFFGAFAELGFGDLRSQHDESWTPCLFDMNWDAPTPPSSPLALEQVAFIKTHALPEKRKPVVVARTAPSAAAPKPPSQSLRPGLWQRVRRILGG